MPGTSLSVRAHDLADALAARAREEQQQAERARAAEARARVAEESRIATALGPWEGTPPARDDVIRDSWDRPDDPWGHLEVARHALQVEPRATALAARHLTAALALRPSSEALRAHLSKLR